MRKEALAKGYQLCYHLRAQIMVTRAGPSISILFRIQIQDTR